MTQTAKKTIVVSAVNLNRGGTLRILQDCLSYLSTLAKQDNYRIIAIVYSRSLADFDCIEYIETQWPKKRWVNRLWYEYVSLKKISKDIGPIDLWLSLHDTTPNVSAKIQAVYCHNSFPFLKWKINDVIFAPKIVLFAIFSIFFYKKNIHKNRFLIVQQAWFRTEFVRLFKLKAKNVIVFPPSNSPSTVIRPSMKKNGDYSFIYPAISDSHKNFEYVCEAAEILWNEGISNFNISFTISGLENPYTKWLYRKWSHIPTIKFIGYQNRKTLNQYFSTCDALIFSSRVETWGLPISEFAVYKKPMFLADLPYARETAQGNESVAFFDLKNPSILAKMIKDFINGDQSQLRPVIPQVIENPLTKSWSDLFNIMLQN